MKRKQRLKYIKYLDDKIKECVLINNKLKQKLMTNQNINIKKKIEYLINKQIKEYEKLYTDDLNMNENFNDIKYKNNYTNNNNDLASIEKLGLICKYNPYYIEEKYKNKLDCKIFDLFDLNDVDGNFIDEFRHMNFEIIFDLII